MLTEARVLRPGKLSFTNFATSGEVVVTDVSAPSAANRSTVSPTSAKKPFASARAP